MVLYTTLDDPDWPDMIDEENGLFVYYGDNKKPGYDLRDRRAGRGGNLILERAFELAHSGPEQRALVPPFFIFSKSALRRDVAFRGLAVPGAAHLDASSDLIAIWKSAAGQRFQNYRAVFTILDVGSVSREWPTELLSGTKCGPNCPSAWREWVNTGKARTLKAEKVTRVRTKVRQLGDRPDLLGIVHDHFKDAPIGFESFTARIVRMMDENVLALDVIPSSRSADRLG